MIAKRLAIVAFRCWLIFGLVFILAPVLSLILMSFHKGRVQSFPIEEFSTDWYKSALETTTIRDGFWNSIKVGVVVAPFSSILGVLSARALRRRPIRYESAYVAIIMLPCLLPLLLSGFAILAYFRQIGIPSGYWAIVIAQVCYCSPFSMALLRNANEGLDVDLERAAVNLGASWLDVLLRVVLPQIWPSFLSSLIVCFLLSWDEFVLAWFVGGFTQTLPVVVYNATGSSVTPAFNAIGVIAMGISIAFLFTAYAMQRVVRNQGT